MKIKLITIASVAAITLAQNVQAIPIAGNIGFSGAVQLNTGSVQTSTTAVNWLGVVANDSSGSFATVPDNTPVVMASPWQFTSGALANFWSVGGFTYNLISSTIALQNSQFLNVRLVGTASGNGYDVTAFTGTFQVGNPAANGLTTFTERMSFAPIPATVPDGGTTALLLGTVGVGLAIIKRKSVTA